MYRRVHQPYEQVNYTVCVCEKEGDEEKKFLDREQKIGMKKQTNKHIK